MTRVRQIAPKDAWKLMQENPKAILIDVRSSMEFLFVGHPTGAIHIPWIEAPDWTINPNFVTEVRKLMLGGAEALEDAPAPPILLICRSGRRSLHAGEVLTEAGFSEVYNVEEGFEGDLDDNRHRSTQGGWRFHGLPWEQC